MKLFCPDVVTIVVGLIHASMVKSDDPTLPVVVDAGLGAPSPAADAFEMGADAVLVNTAIAVASDPVRMALAFKAGVEAGRSAYEIGLGQSAEEASATSPLTTFLYQ